MAETWVLNAKIALPRTNGILVGTFTSNGNEYKSIGVVTTGTLTYGRSSTTLSGGPTVYRSDRGWINDAYRTLVFDPAPTGAMLTWLQANGVKQSDPEPETPTNSCLVDGTVYGIKTGQTLVNGTARTIYNGRALVAGAGCDIVLSSKNPTITITGTGNASQACVVCNGVTYTGATEFTVEPGTMITLHAKSDLSNAKATITVDGTIVRSGVDVSYPYAVNSSINVNLELRDYGPATYGAITVTITE